MGVGDQSGLWGGTTNTNLGTALEQAIVGRSALVTGDFTDNEATLTLANTNASQTARAFVLDVTATLTAAGTINVPAVQKPYLVFNNTVGGFSLTVKVLGLPGVTIPNGDRTLVYCNGTDVVQGLNFTSGGASAVTTTLTATNTNFFVPFVPAAATGSQALGVDAGLSYNPASNALTSGIAGGTF